MIGDTFEALYGERDNIQPRAAMVKYLVYILLKCEEFNFLKIWRCIQSTLLMIVYSHFLIALWKFSFFRVRAIIDNDTSWPSSLN